MEYHAFPFELIKRGSRIILYAAGNVGRSYYRQISETAHCKIVLWVDKNINNKIVFSPEAIKELREDEYDYVIIALNNDDVIGEVYKSLIEYGVSSEKIFAQTPAQAWFSLLTLDELFHDIHAVKDALRKYFYKSNGNIYYFDKLIKELKIAKNTSDEIALRIVNTAMRIATEELTDPQMRIVFLWIFFEADCFSSELFRMYLKFTGEIKQNISQKYWLLTSANTIWLQYSNVLYDEFYIDMQRTTVEYAKELSLSLPVPKIFQKENNNNICVLSTNGLLPSTITRFISPFITELSRREYNVHLFDLQPFLNDSMANFLNITRYSNDVDAALYKEHIREFYPNDIRLYYPSSINKNKVLEEVLDWFAEINPYCILDASGDYSYISSIYYKMYPTIFIPLRNQGASSSFFHKIIITNPEIKLSPPLREEQVLSLPVFHKCSDPMKIFRRNDFGFLKDDIIVVTVGKRLAFEISTALIDQFCYLLSSDRRIKWLLVGTSEIPYLQSAYPQLLEKSVFLLEYESDLPGLFGMCDIYLNPERIGGGTTIAWAMQQGVAVVSPLGASAGYALVGKINSMPKETDLVPRIYQLSKDYDLLTHSKKLSLETAKHWSVKNFVDGLIRGMDELAVAFMPES